MKDSIEIPGGHNYLKPLLFPFHKNYPLKLFSKFRWWKNKYLSKKLSLLNSRGKWLTVINRLGARGDTLITGNVIRCIKAVYPDLKINCITPFSELLQNEPTIDSINQPETFYSFDSTYLELIVRNEKYENVVAHNLKRLGIKKFEYKSHFYLSKEEISWAEDLIKRHTKPIIAISSRSKEEIKNWPIKNWMKLVSSIYKSHDIIHLGDKYEPKFDNVTRFAGMCSMRESAALLSQCQLFIGPDSLLMHMANGLDIKSIIIFGKARPVNCLGYPDNINVSLPSKDDLPSWIRLEDTDQIDDSMEQITVDSIIQHIDNAFHQESFHPSPERKHRARTT